MRLRIEELDMSIEINPVSPLTILRSVLEARSQEPEPPMVSYSMPDGEAQERPNLGDPTYKEAMERFHAEVETSVRNALIDAGVSKVQIGTVMGADESIRQRVAAHIKAISMPTEGGIQAVMGAAEALFVEGMISARWADMRLNEFWGLPIDMQNLLIGARRRALGEQISLLRPRGNNGLARNGVSALGSSGEEGVASGVSGLGPDGLPGIPADRVGELV